MSQNRGKVVQNIMAVSSAAIFAILPAAASLVLYLKSLSALQEARTFYLSHNRDNYPDVFVMDFLAASLFRVDLPRILRVPYVTIAPGLTFDPGFPPTVIPNAALLLNSLLPHGEERTLGQHALALSIRVVRTNLMACAALVINAHRLLHGLPAITWPFDPMIRAPLLIARQAAPPVGLFPPLCFFASNTKLV